MRMRKSKYTTKELPFAWYIAAVSAILGPTIRTAPAFPRCRTTPIIVCFCGRAAGWSGYAIVARPIYTPG